MKRSLMFAVILATSGTVFAQQRPEARPERPAAGQQQGQPPPRVRNYDFDADFIDGELVRPEGEFLSPRTAAEHGSLIRVRTDFIREIVKSAEDL